MEKSNVSSNDKFSFTLSQCQGHEMEWISLNKYAQRSVFFYLLHWSQFEFRLSRMHLGTELKIYREEVGARGEVWIMGLLVTSLQCFIFTGVASAAFLQVSFEMMKDDPKTRLLSAREALLPVLFCVTKFPGGLELTTQPGLRQSPGRDGEWISAAQCLLGWLATFVLLAAPSPCPRRGCRSRVCVFCSTEGSSAMPW